LGDYVGDFLGSAGVGSPAFAFAAGGEVDRVFGSTS